MYMSISMCIPYTHSQEEKEQSTMDPNNLSFHIYRGEVQPQLNQHNSSSTMHQPTSQNPNNIPISRQYSLVNGSDNLKKESFIILKSYTQLEGILSSHQFTTNTLKRIQRKAKSSATQKMNNPTILRNKQRRKFLIKRSINTPILIKKIQRNSHNLMKLTDKDK